MIIREQAGLSYKLDLKDGSAMIAPTPSPQLKDLPILPDSYGNFIAGSEHFTQRVTPMQMLQVIVTRSGCGRIEIEGRQYDLTPDTICLLNFRQPHRYGTVGEVWNYEWANFYGSAVDAYARLVDPDGFTVYSLRGDQEVMHRFRELADHYHEHDPLGLTHSATRIIRLLDAMVDLRVNLERSRIDVRHGNIQLSIDYIHAHYGERVTLDDLAAAAFMSKFHYTRQFSKYIGMSPYEYLISVRLAHARNLLMTTDMSVDEIAWSTGFINSKNLIRQFRQATAITPGEYRKSAGVLGGASQ